MLDRLGLILSIAIILGITGGALAQDAQHRYLTTPSAADPYAPNYQGAPYPYQNEPYGYRGDAYAYQGGPYTYPGGAYAYQGGPVPYPGSTSMLIQDRDYSAGVTGLAYCNGRC